MGASFDVLGKILPRCLQAEAPLIGRILFFTVENEAMRTLYCKNFGVQTRILPLPFGDHVALEHIQADMANNGEVQG
ncbi:MAG: hypothetical protein M3Z96_14140 [Pseudomonadota bacterium]|nr:hypothetical protein [Pseudomonadota bacterium]